MNIVVSGLTTAYSEVGSGKPLVALHGWGDSSKTFAGLAKVLGGTNRVIALDLPGFGGTAAPQTAWSLDDYGAFVTQFLRKLDVHDYALIGHSNGGAIIINGVGSGMLKPEKIILLASAGVRPKKTVKRTAFTVVAKVGKVGASMLPGKTRRKLQSRLYQAAGSDALVAAGMRETFVKITRQDVQKQAALVTVPTLLINGAKDKDVPLSQGQLLHPLIAGSTLVTLPEAGHFVHIDEPATVAAAVKDFLS